MLLARTAFCPPDVLKMSAVCRGSARVRLDHRVFGKFNVQKVWPAGSQQRWQKPQKRVALALTSHIASLLKTGFFLQKGFRDSQSGPQTHPPVLFACFVRGNNWYSHTARTAGGHNSRKVAVARSSNCRTQSSRLSHILDVNTVRWCIKERFDVAGLRKRRRGKKKELTKITWNFLCLLTNMFP